jgi:hypothetical protein
MVKGQASEELRPPSNYQGAFVVFVGVIGQNNSLSGQSRDLCVASGRAG